MNLVRDLLRNSCCRLSQCLTLLAFCGDYNHLVKRVNANLMRLHNAPFGVAPDFQKSPNHPNYPTYFHRPLLFSSFLHFSRTLYFCIFIAAHSVNSAKLLKYLTAWTCGGSLMTWPVKLSHRPDRKPQVDKEKWIGASIYARGSAPGA